MSNITRTFLQLLDDASAVHQCASTHGLYTFHGICALLWYHAVKEVSSIILAVLKRRKLYRPLVDDNQSPRNDTDLTDATDTTDAEIE
jgi:hypothetical protein